MKLNQKDPGGLNLLNPNLAGLKVTVMGLGLHGGGLASAYFFASRGATVTGTDLQQDNNLLDSMSGLNRFPIRYVLGKHSEDDFLKTDLVIKNPAVPHDSPFLRLSCSKSIPVETDISIFLRIADNPIIGVTGSKGKSTTASAIHHCLKKVSSGAKLGGNITVSPLSFADELNPGDPVVLELSSWQLADLKAKEVFKPRISIIVNIMPDHMNRYAKMEDYIADKVTIIQQQDREDFAVLNQDDPAQRDFPYLTKARVFTFSGQSLPDGAEGAFLAGQTGILRRAGRDEEILADRILLPGTHNRLNLLAGGLAANLFGIAAGDIRSSLASFKGLEHRLEFVAKINAVSYYNDSAATIPNATVCALKSLPPPVCLIAGGTDKNIDFSPLEEVASLPSMIILLEGSATEKIVLLLKRLGLAFEGPLDSLEKAVRLATQNAAPGSTVLFSPGCASFGMFQDEFDRGRRFKKLVKEILA